MTRVKAHRNPLVTVSNSLKGRSATSGQTLITDYLPAVKKSQRIANQKKPNQEEELKLKCISKGIDPNGFLIHDFGPEKGKGVIVAEDRSSVAKGDFLCEYSGHLISLKEARRREKRYDREQLGSYMYYFEWKNQKHCVDATIDETGKSLGRLINHSRKAPNCKTSVYEYRGQPHLIFVATRDIAPGQELLYDYGETDRVAIDANPWLVNS